MKALRLCKGFTLSEFASRIGTTHGHLANIEAGRRTLNRQIARQAAQVLDVPVIAILSERDIGVD